MTVAIRRKRPGDAPEADWDDVVQDYADLRGWWSLHVTDARRLRAGFLDWFLVRPPRLVLLETKVPGGRVTRAQAELLGLLERCPCVEAYCVVFPDDWPRVREVLR